MNSKGQGTIEYLIILAIIIVLALLVVSFVGGFANTGSGINKTQSEAYWKSQEIGVTDAIVDSNGDAVLVVSSTSTKQLTIKKFFINDTEVDVPDTKIFNGTKSFFVENLPACTTETCSYDLKIEYTNKYGTDKIIKGTTKLITKQTTDATENNVADSGATIVKMTGTGTSEDPYLIKTCLHLQAMNDSKSSIYHLANNIDCSDTINWNDGNGFLPVSTFSGDFDGQNYTINNLYINRPTTNYIGLFGITGYADVNNVGLIDVNIIGQYDVGGLTGVSQNSLVYNSYSTGNVNGYERVGGLIGYNQNRYVYNSHSSCTVSGTDRIGGLIGYINGPVYKSYSTGDVNGNSYIGGLIGYASNSVNESYSTGDVNGNGRVGGLIGHNSNTIYNSYSTSIVDGGSYTGGLVGQCSGSVTKSYFAGTVDGTSGVGGLVGRLYSINFVSNSYSTGKVIGTYSIGGLIGSFSASLTNGYWDRTSSNQSNCHSGGDTNCTKITDNPTYWHSSSNPPMNEWDFDTIWQENSGTYPTLQWQN